MTDESSDKRTWLAELVPHGVYVFFACVAAFCAVEFMGQQNAKDIAELKIKIETVISVPVTLQQNIKDIEELKASRTAMYAKMSETFTSLHSEISSVDTKLNAMTNEQARIGQSLQDIKEGLNRDRERHSR